MYDEPEESPEGAGEKKLDPITRAREKADECRINAELAAIFEGPRKFDAELRPLKYDAAREVQRAMGKLDKAREGESAVLPASARDEAMALLRWPAEREMTTNDYHVSRRPGEVMIARWLRGSDEVDAFYERLQAHFDAALEGFKEDEREAHGWKKDPAITAYLEALEKLEISMADRYRREGVRTKGVAALSTVTADEINIAFIAETIMGVSNGELVGEAAAPPEEAPSEQDLAWFFKLFSLRGMDDEDEAMCFFAFLQKTDDSGW
jgi:hypothetical protein